MRTYILNKALPVLGLVLASLSYAQTNTENYVQSRTCLNDDCTKVSEAITYFDGLGRPKQIISVKSTPTGKDLVTPVTYDGFGRKVKDILPVPADTQNSMIHPGIVNESAANTYYGANNAYSEKEVENSPLDRVLQQAAPGEPWKMSSGKTQKLGYDANLGNEVRKFRAVTTPSTVNNVSTGISALSVSTENSGYYPASTLYKNTVTDEDGNPVTEFTNGQGQTLLVRRNDGSQNVDTYYVYNDYNQLAYVLSPKAVQQISQNNNTITDAVLSELCYQYRYDGRSRLVEKKLPGKDWEWMVYDKQDRLVLSQDGMLRTAANTFNSKGWMFTKYDGLGRVAYTGFFSNTASRQVMQNALNSMVANPYNNEERSRIPFTLQGIEVYYTRQAFPTGSMTLLSVNYYDTYPPEAPAIPATVLGQHILAQANNADNDASTNSLATASYVRNIEDTNWTKNYTWYDTMGRAVSTHSINHLGGRTQTESKLDFAGAVQQTITRHKRLNADTDRVITENFTYDTQNRLLTHTHQVDSNTPEILVQNTYNEISQLTNKKVGGTVASNPLQSIDYLYNIRGWMTKINDPKNLSGKLFGYEIKYNLVEGLETPDALNAGLKVLPRYNGNIAEVDWRTGTVQGDYLRRYGYVYDKLSRLSAGFYQSDANPSAQEYFEKMTYDLNGNIASLKRSADQGENATASAIDNLTYVYANGNASNRLVSVTDSSGDYRGYPDTSGTAIEYDVNGNMTSQKDKGILQINYNFLNLPDYIKFDKTYFPRAQDTQADYFINTQYLYRSDGIKLQKIYTYATGGRDRLEENRTTQYLDGFQYEADTGLGYSSITLQFVPTAEGYYDFVKNKYIYNYADHLGNVRLSYFNNGSSTEVLQENNYYPFGLKHEGYNPLAGNPAYQYKYNGKELQTDSGMYDYGARFYMPDIGRWGVVDPAAELGRRFSTYNYAFDNPIMFVDPDGMWPWPTWSQAKKFASGYAKGAWSTAGSMIKGTLTSTYTGITGGIREAGKVYKAYKSGGIKAAGNQYVQSVYETSGAKAIVNTAKGVAKGDAESIESAVVTVVAAVVTHKAAGGTKSGKVGAAETSTMSELTNTVKSTVADLKAAGKAPATVVGAELNGQTVVGTSGPPPATIASQLEGVVGELGGLGTKTASGNTVGCCSEFHTGNQLLLDNPSATPSQINFTEAIRPRDGSVIPMCDNCKTTFNK